MASRIVCSRLLTNIYQGPVSYADTNYSSDLRVESYETSMKVYNISNNLTAAMHKINASYTTQNNLLYTNEHYTAIIYNTYQRINDTFIRLRLPSMINIGNNNLNDKITDVLLNIVIYCNDENQCTNVMQPKSHYTDYDVEIDIVNRLFIIVIY